MVDEERRRPLLKLGDRGERDLPARGRRDVDARKGGGRALKRGVHLHNHSVLVRLGEDGRDDALAERVIEGVVNRRSGYSEPCGRVPVDVHVGGQSVLGQVGRDVIDLGKLAKVPYFVAISCLACDC